MADINPPSFNFQQKGNSFKAALIAIILIAVAGVTTIGNSQKPSAQVEGTQTSVTNTPTPTFTPTPTPTLKPTDTPIPTIFVPTATPAQSSGLSNDNYYTNVNGNQVHSPAFSNSVPAGATAICGDGTYSFSQHRSGTCSHHGGVSQWL